jgi:hypothetical protein
VRVRSALEFKRASFYERYPEDQKFTLYYPERDENSTISWTTFPTNPVGDKIKINVKNPHSEHPFADIKMLGGGNNTYSFEFRVKHMRRDVYEDEIDRVRRAESSAPTTKKNQVRAWRSNESMATKERRSNITFNRGLDKARTAAKTAEENAELQSILRPPRHPFSVTEGGTRKNGRRRSKTHRVGKKNK